MKKFLSRFLIIFSICFLFSCSNGINEPGSNNTPNNTNPGDNPTNNTPKISSEYWGTWIQMDTGNEIYIDNQNVYRYYSSSSKSKLQAGIDGYSLESDEVMKKGTTVFFRKGGKKRSFSATVSGFSATGNRSARAAGTGSQGITGRRTNEENEDDTETVDSDDGSSVDFEGGVADDPQTVTITDGENTGEATVTPEYDGENVGSIPVVEPGKYAFKTTYKISNAEAQGFMYGNNLGVYNISLNITNIGEETCATSLYTITWDDINLKSSDLVTQGNFTSIGPGSAKTISGNFSYGYFDEEYKDVVVKISITDSKYEKTWNDYVTLRFYRGYVNFKINARNFNQSSNAKLNGFLVYPDGRSRRFNVSSGSSFTLPIPWSTKDYYLVFSGANNDTEMCYSFVADEYGSPADLNGVWSISDINAFEPNDTLQNSIAVTNYTQSTKAYLKNGDIDYFKINITTLNCSKGTVIYSGHNFSDSTSINSTYNNKDGTINPGETIWMDIKVYNSSSLKINNVNIEASSTSQYITFNANTANYGNIKAKYYQSYYGSKYSYQNSGWPYTNTDEYSVNSDSYTPFKFTISSSCPIGTVIPISLKISEENGYEWTDSFTITVVKTGADIEYAGHNFSDSTSIDNTYNNKDNNINPGETIWMDIKIFNKGSSQAKSITVEANSTSQYITFTSNSGNYGNINSRYYQSYYGSQYRYTTGGWPYTNTDEYSLNSETYTPFKFTISQNCPVNTVIPINLKFSDTNGYEWTDSFNITVVKTGAKIIYSGNSFNDAISINSANNKDGTINPGETIWMDVKLFNEGTSQAKNIQLEASSTSQYITFTSNTATYGNINSRYYQSYYGSQYRYTTGGWNTSNTDEYSLNSETYTPLKFTISESVPINTVIPINLKFTDIYGYEWTDSFNITILNQDVDMEYVAYKLSNYDGSIMNADTTRNLDICIHNKGKSLAKAITVTLSTEYPHIQFTKNNASYGNVAGKYYKTYYQEKYYSSNTGTAAQNGVSYNINNVTYVPFILKAVSDIPRDTVIPIQILITDEKGNQWSSNFNLNEEI